MIPCRDPISTQVADKGSWFEMTGLSSQRGCHFDALHLFAIKLQVKIVALSFG